MIDAAGEKVRHCDECGKPMARVVRVEDGHAYCGTCYSRVFKRVPCSICGGPTRARKDGHELVCPACRGKDRSCGRCGKLIGKAGRIVGGKAVCTSCAPYYAELKPCANCGQLSRRRSRAPGSGLDEPVCDRCRNQDFETCSVCRRYRAVERRGEMGRPMCHQCAAEEPVTHICPACGSSVPGGGSSPCADCSLKDRIRRRVKLNVELLEQPWVRSLFEGFCAWDGLRKAAGNMTARIDRYAVFFAAMDRSCEAPQVVTQRRLFDIFGAEGLRRGFLAVSFLCERLALEWDAATLEDLIEARRIDQQGETWRDRPWAAGLQRYVDELERGGPPRLKQKTVRMYQTAAGGLLEMAGVESPGALTQGHLDRYLKRHPGQTANLSAFVRHLRESSGVALELRKRAGTPLPRKDRTLVQRVQSLTRSLDTETNERRAKALLAVLLANLYQVPIKDVLALSTEYVMEEPEAIVLWPGTRDVRIAGRLAELFRRWIALSQGAGSGLLFAGRNGVQPLSYDAVRYHLQIFARAPYITDNRGDS